MGKVIVILMALVMTSTSTLSSARGLSRNPGKAEMQACIDSLPKIMNCVSMADLQSFPVRITPRWTLKKLQWIPIFTETAEGQKLTAIRYLFKEIESKWELEGATFIKGYEQYPSVVMSCKDGQIGSIEYQLDNGEDYVNSYPLICQAATP